MCGRSTNAGDHSRYLFFVLQDVRLHGGYPEDHEKRLFNPYFEISVCSVTLTYQAALGRRLPSRSNGPLAALSIVPLTFARVSIPVARRRFPASKSPILSTWRRRPPAESPLTCPTDWPSGSTSEWIL